MSRILLEELPYARFTRESICVRLRDNPAMFGLQAICMPGDAYDWTGYFNVSSASSSSSFDLAKHCISNYLAARAILA